VSRRFTCGVRTSGRVESKNRINKLISDSKTSLIDVVNNLVKSAEDQDDLEKLRLIHQHCVAYAVQKSYDQMERSVFYEASIVSLPAGATTWGVLNSFADDSIRISAQFMLHLIADRGWVCEHLFKISHYASATVHFIAVLDNGHIICDCMMGTNLGIPCRHFYTLLRSFKSRQLVTFHLGLFNSRYAALQSLILQPHLMNLCSSLDGSNTPL
ncbi:hypothetical protein B0H19DRAFT_958648, partial [Mycena capillaripes]